MAFNGHFVCVCWLSVSLKGDVAILVQSAKRVRG